MFHSTWEIFSSLKGEVLLGEKKNTLPRHWGGQRSECRAPCVVWPHCSGRGWGGAEGQGHRVRCRSDGALPSEYNVDQNGRAVATRGTFCGLRVLLSQGSLSMEMCPHFSVTETTFSVLQVRMLAKLSTCKNGTIMVLSASVNCLLPTPILTFKTLTFQVTYVNMGKCNETGEVS